MGDLPQAAIDLLPLSAEPMSEWKQEVDIRQFARALYPPPFYSPSIAELDDEVVKEMREQARVFTKNLMEAHNRPTYIDFYQDHWFGQVAKYALAFKCCIQSLLEDAGFYSLAHVLEADDDLNCSLLLASHFYYKQATFMLRNIVEETLLPIHFCDSISDFNAWRADSFRTPTLRGQDGLIKRLLKRNMIDEPLATRVSNLYRDLSSYVHGSQSTLIHRNVHLGESHHVEFQEDSFSAWCQLFCECIDVCIRLLKINFDQWKTIRSLKFETLAKVGKTFCNTCHNEDAFDRWLLPSKYVYFEHEDENVLENVKDLAFYWYICQVCGHTITVNAVETPLKRVVCFSTEGLPPGSAIEKITHLVRNSADPHCEWYNVQTKAGDILTPLLVHLSTEKTPD
jgi:hypothetical protein